MACANKFSEERSEGNNNKFKVSCRKDYCQIESVDITKEFIAYYMRARFFLLAGPAVVATPEEAEHTRELFQKEVKPFIEELDKVLGLD